MDPSYISVFVMVPFAIAIAVVWIFYERARRRNLDLLDQGYYFVESASYWNRRPQLIPVPPQNVDFSNPGFPRVMNMTIPAGPTFF